MLINRIITPVITALLVVLCLLVSNTYSSPLSESSSRVPATRLMLPTSLSAASAGGVGGPGKETPTIVTFTTTITNTEEPGSREEPTSITSNQFDRVKRFNQKQNVLITKRWKSRTRRKLAADGNDDDSRWLTVRFERPRPSPYHDSLSTFLNIISNRATPTTITEDASTHKHKKLAILSKRFYRRLRAMHAERVLALPESQIASHMSRTKRGGHDTPKVDTRPFRLSPAFGSRSLFLAVEGGDHKRFVTSSHDTDTSLFVSGMTTHPGSDIFLYNLKSQSFICFDLRSGYFVPKKTFEPRDCSLVETMHTVNNKLTYKLSRDSKIRITFSRKRGQLSYNLKTASRDRLAHYYTKSVSKLELEPWMRESIKSMLPSLRQASQVVTQQQQPQKVVASSHPPPPSTSSPGSSLAATPPTTIQAELSTSNHSSLSPSMPTVHNANTPVSMNTTENPETAAATATTMTTSTAMPLTEWEKIGKGIFAAQLSQYPEMSNLLHHDLEHQSDRPSSPPPFYQQLHRYLSKHNELKTQEKTRMVKLTEIRLDSGGPLHAVRHVEKKIEHSTRLD